MCSEMALTLRLKVDAALAVPALSKMICSSPCVGALNVGGFFGVKEWQGNLCSPLTFGFTLALAGVDDAMQLFGCLINESSMIDGFLAFLNYNVRAKAI